MIWGKLKWDELFSVDLVRPSGSTLCEDYAQCFEIIESRTEFRLMEKVVIPLYILLNGVYVWYSYICNLRYF